MNPRCIRAILVACLVIFTVKSYSQKVAIGPVPGWVKPVEPDLAVKPKAGTSGSHYYLLFDRQENVAARERFVHFAYTILTNEGVQEMSDVSVDFDPGYERLTFHKIVIRRSGTVINQLPKGTIETIQREKSMDRYLYDGELTAIVHLKDVRIGDVIEYTFSYKGYNPVFDGHLGDKVYVDFGVPYEHLYRRLLLPPGRDIHLRYANGEVTPEVTQTPAGKEYIWSVKHVEPLSGSSVIDGNVPEWYDQARTIQLTDFNNWAEVATWAVKHFEVPATEKAQLKKHTAGILTATDTTARILEAIRFVQDEIRYLGFEAGLNSHKPHAPVKVFEQRFGDCKDKSLLLSAILQTEGIEAYPMLVNSSTGNKLGDDLPYTGAFDHCVVQIRYKDKDIFVDPTINNQGGTLNGLYFPDYGKGLVIRTDTKDLIDLPTPVSDITETQSFIVEQAGGGARLTVKMVYTGSEADAQRSEFASNSIETIRRSYLSYYSDLYPDITMEDSLELIDNRAENILEVQEHYRIDNFWTRGEDGDGQAYCKFYPQMLAWYFDVPEVKNRKTPFRLSAYPTSYHHYILVTLPQEWEVKSEQNEILSDYYDYKYDVSGVGNRLTIYHYYKPKEDHVPVDYMSKFLSDHKQMKKELPYYVSVAKTKPTRDAWQIGIVSVIALALIFIINRRTRSR